MSNVLYHQCTPRRAAHTCCVFLALHFKVVGAMIFYTLMLLWTQVLVVLSRKLISYLFNDVFFRIYYMVSSRRLIVTYNYELERMLPVFKKNYENTLLH